MKKFLSHIYCSENVNIKTSLYLAHYIKQLSTKSNILYPFSRVRQMCVEIALLLMWKEIFCSSKLNLKSLYVTSRFYCATISCFLLVSVFYNAINIYYIYIWSRRKLTIFLIYIYIYIHSDTQRMYQLLKWQDEGTFLTYFMQNLCLCMHTFRPRNKI